MRNLPVVLALSGSESFTKTINIPVLSEKQKNLRRMIELEAKQAIPETLRNSTGATTCRRLLMAPRWTWLCLRRRELIHNLVAMGRRLGMEIAGISLSSLAIYNFVKFDQDFEDDETVAVLDVGAENTELLVYQGDSLWMRSLNVSGNEITRAFQKKFRVSLEEAEQLKTQVADSRQADKIIKVIESNLMELVTDVQRSLGFYKTQNREAQFETVVVAGNTFRLPGLRTNLWPIA